MSKLSLDPNLSAKQLEQLAELAQNKANEMRQKEEKREQCLEKISQRQKEHQQELIDLAKEFGFTLQELNIGDKKPSAPKKPKPVKYVTTDADGKQVYWSGVGRAPKLFSGADLESMKITQEQYASWANQNKVSAPYPW